MVARQHEYVQPYVYLIIDGKRRIAILDTGSPVNILPKRLVEHGEPHDDFKITAVNGQPVLCYGIKKYKTKMGCMEDELDYYVMDSNHILIGYETMVKHNFHICIPERKVKTGGDRTIAKLLARTKVVHFALMTR